MIIPAAVNSWNIFGVVHTFQTVQSVFILFPPSLSFPGSCSTRLLGTNKKGPWGRGCIEVDIAIFGLWIHDDTDYLFMVYYHFATDTS